MDGSGSGKTSIVKELCKECGFNKIITYTTRIMRKDEKNGIDYYFISKEDFEKKIYENFFGEYAVYSGNYYGSRKSDYNSESILIIEKKGLDQLLPNCETRIIPFYIKTTEKTRIKRMRQRGDSEDTILRRIINDKTSFLIPDSFKYTINNNKNIKEAVKEIVYILVVKENFWL